MEDESKPVAQLIAIKPSFLVLFIPKNSPHLQLFHWCYYPEDVDKFIKSHENEVVQVIRVQKGY